VDIPCIIKIKTLVVARTFNFPQSHKPNDSQYSSTYRLMPVVFRGWLTDAVLSRTSLYISQPASQTPAGLIIQKS